MILPLKIFALNKSAWGCFCDTFIWRVNFNPLKWKIRYTKELQHFYFTGEGFIVAHHFVRILIISFGWVRLIDRKSYQNRQEFQNDFLRLNINKPRLRRSGKPPR
jgi:hypothetical protein